MGIFEIVLLGAGALLASTLAAIAGFGGAAVLLPIVVLVFGVGEAIPILTVAQLIGNGGRVWFNRRQLEIPLKQDSSRRPLRRIGF